MLIKVLWENAKKGFQIDARGIALSTNQELYKDWELEVKIRNALEFCYMNFWINTDTICNEYILKWHNLSEFRVKLKYLWVR